MPQKRSPLLLKLLTRLGEVTVKEAYLARPHGCGDVYGYWDPDGTITINPVPHIVNSLLHELLHEACPSYSERAVCSITGKLMKRLTEEELQAIYAEYVRKRDESL